MADENTTELHRAKRGAAILATIIVQTINETDPTFKERFLARLARGYRELKDNTDGDVVQEMELLTWTNIYLTGWDNVAGQNAPFLGDEG
jgi:hypothetical protein